MAHAEAGVPMDVSDTKPKTFDELKLISVRSCRRCGSHATHTLSVTAAELGAGKGATVATLPRTPVCEACAVEIFMVVRRALKA